MRKFAIPSTLHVTLPAPFLLPCFVPLKDFRFLRFIEIFRISFCSTAVCAADVHYKKSMCYACDQATVTLQNGDARIHMHAVQGNG